MRINELLNLIPALFSDNAQQQTDSSYGQKPLAVNCFTSCQGNTIALGIFLDYFLKQVEQNVFKND